MVNTRNLPSATLCGVDGCRPNATRRCVRWLNATHSFRGSRRRGLSRRSSTRTRPLRVRSTPPSRASPLPATAYHLRWMVARDFPTVVKIDAACAPPFWSEDEFATRLRMTNCIGMVCEGAFEPVGFMLYDLHRTCLRLIRFAVAVEYRN